MIPKSGVSHVAWPAVPDRAGASLLALQHQFAESERLSPGELERLQFEALGRVLRHAVTTVPYYSERASYCELAAAQALDPQSWSRLPVLERADVQEAGTALESGSVPSDHGTPEEICTSGSTGRPLRTLRTAVTQLFWQAVTLREQLWHERDLSGRWAAIRTDRDGKIPPHGAKGRNWGPPASAVYETGPGGVMSAGTDVVEQAEWLIEYDPHYLMTLPSNLVALACHFLDSGVKLPRLQQVCTYGETLTPDLRPLCAETWGVGVVDVYSTQELGYLALQCPADVCYHVQAEMLYLEVLDDNGRPCLPGDVGRVVVSTMHNYAMPLLRYEVGDYAEVGSPCSCGRTLPVLNRIVGRTRNMLSLPGGRRIWPTFGRTWQEITSIRQIQLVQHDLGHIEARLVTTRRLTTEEEERFAQIVGQRFGHPFAVTFTYLDRIDRSRNLKFDDFVSLLPPPGAGHARTRQEGE